MGESANLNTWFISAMRFKNKKKIDSFQKWSIVLSFYASHFLDTLSLFRKYLLPFPLILFFRADAAVSSHGSHRGEGKKPPDAFSAFVQSFSSVVASEIGDKFCSLWKHQSLILSWPPLWLLLWLRDITGWLSLLVLYCPSFLWSLSLLLSNTLSQRLSYPVSLISWSQFYSSSAENCSIILIPMMA